MAELERRCKWHDKKIGKDIKRQENNNNNEDGKRWIRTRRGREDGKEDDEK